MTPVSTDLRTSRLLLRRWAPADRAPFAALNADARAMEHFPAPLDRTASDALADRADAHLAEHGWGLWAVEVADGEDAGRFAGFTGLAVPRFEAAFTPCVEIGWRLTPWSWGRGYATEAARAALGVAFEDVALEEVVSFTAATNTRSRAVMERLGMRRDPDDDFDHPNLPPGHRLRRHVLHRLPAGAWRAQQPGPAR
ncbi:GNAT family N-acetyltransferase [uncultured Pseudokineococcus sp.]|uniref:GNAT family N-acetyltransferase n=1 Tax=uncultured Pseudokineococcus sp. TaxID=1642928 RepID=UPI00262AABE8|nr:GNAT family N-acetyltransferase [uncultured Pseudokineococcus sp.]